MSDSSAPSNDTGLPQSIREMADAIPGDAFGPGFERDEEERRPAAPPAQEARAPREAPEDPGHPPTERQPTERRRGPDGKFAPAEQAPDPAEADQEPQEWPQDGDEAPVGTQEPQEGEEPSEEPQEGKKKEPSLFMEIDGRRYSAEDIHRGFLRNEDYTRKTQELAQHRQAIHGHAQQIQAYEQQLGTLTEITVQALRDTLPPQPDISMIDHDPVGYQKQMAAHARAVERLQQISGHHDHLSSRNQQEQQAFMQQQQAATQQALQGEFEQMQAKIPELRTPEGRDTFSREAQKYGAYYGLAPADIGAIQDHRALLVLKDAIAYRKLQAQKPQTVERLKAAPPIRPQARPAAGIRSGQAKREATERFEREPSLKNALATGIMDDIFPT